MFVFNYRYTGSAVYETGFLFSIGVHPWDSALVNPGYLVELGDWLKHPMCFALGECGLDHLNGPAMDIQMPVFADQLTLALRLQKPVIIHCVRAFDELLSICRPYLGRIPLIIHGFGKSQQLARQLIDKGFYLSLNPAVLSRDQFDPAALPSDRLFLETDMGPNEGIASAYEALARRLNLSLEALTERINLNFENLKPKEPHGR